MDTNLPTDEELITYSLLLPRLVYDRITGLAAADHRSKAYIVREAVEEYFARRTEEKAS